MPMRQSVVERRALYQLQIDGQWQGLGVRTAVPGGIKMKLNYSSPSIIGDIIRRNGDAGSIGLSIQLGARSIGLDSDLDIEKLYGVQWAKALGAKPTNGLGGGFRSNGPLRSPYLK